MSGIENEHYRAIIEERKEEFLGKMKMFANVGRGRSYGQGIWGFPVLKESDNKLFYEQIYYDELIEYFAWRILLNGVLTDLFSEEYCQDNSIEVKWAYIYPQTTALRRVEYIESKNRIEFSINRAGVKVGYRYTNPHLHDAKEVEKWFELSDISEMVVLDFIDDKSQVPPWKTIIAPKLQDKIHVVAFQDFFQEFFGPEAYICYRDNVRSGIEEIYKYIGLQTIPNLNSQFRAPFINSMNEGISSWKMDEDKYIILDNDNDKIKREKGILSEPDCIISENDFCLMRHNFLTQRRYLALSGNGDFAKSFVTSEYLSDKMLSNNKFEFTAIVTGYLKSVEQLLYKLVLFTLEENPNNKLWMKATPYPPDEIESKCRPINKTKYLPFTKVYLPYFDTTFNSLVNLLEKNREGWIVSNGARRRITTYLKIYCKECRNEHFHKDNIDDPDEVKAIQHNTYFLMFLLLGGYKLNVDETLNKKTLGIVDKSFDSLYSIMMSKFGGGSFYRVHFKNNAPILAAMPMTQDNPEYDESGKLINTTIRFVKVSDDEFRDPEIANWKRYESDYSSQDVLFINDENMPEAIYLVSRNNVEVPLLWDHY